MRQLSTDSQAAILRALCEGNSIRATCRITGAAKGTVMRLLKIVGAHCKNYHDRFVTDLDCERVEADEIWSFCGAKERNVPMEKKGRGRGDVWTFVGICATSKLVVSWKAGKRDAQTAQAFVDDLRDRMSNRIQLTTAALPLYVKAVEQAFGWDNVDYAMLVKIFGKAEGGDPAAHRRYSPAICLGSEKKWVMGTPDFSKVSTSYVERQNLTMRMGMRRYTRLTNAFSKKMEYHLYATALHFMYYNFCRPHQTLTRQCRGIKCTPAMAAGLSERVWTMDDILKLLHGD